MHTRRIGVMISRRRAPVAPVRARIGPPSSSPFLFSSSFRLAYVSPLSAADSLVLHSAASLIVHARLDARNGVACSAINGALRFSIGRVASRTSLFVREFSNPGRTGRSHWSQVAGSARLVCTYIYVCTYARRPPLCAIATEILQGRRASHRGVHKVLRPEIITGVAMLRLSDVQCLSNGRHSSSLYG